MRTIIAAIWITLLTSCIAACGQSGGLYLPDKQPPAANTTQ